MKVAFGLGNVNDLHRTFSKEELSLKQVKSVVAKSWRNRN